MSRNDLIQLCGVADGIRLNNALQARYLKRSLASLFPLYLLLRKKKKIQGCQFIHIQLFSTFRASRPLLTIYISPDWHQSGTGMREYHAMFLEQLTVNDLKRKLAEKCGLDDTEIIAILK